MTLLSWIGNVAIIAGLWFIAEKRRFALLFSMLGESLWIVYSIHSHLWSLAFICCIFLVMWIRSYIKWGVPDATNSEKQ